MNAIKSRASSAQNSMSTKIDGKGIRTATIAAIVIAAGASVGRAQAHAGVFTGMYSESFEQGPANPIGGCFVQHFASGAIPVCGLTISLANNGIGGRSLSGGTNLATFSFAAPVTRIGAYVNTVWYTTVKLTLSSGTIYWDTLPVTTGSWIWTGWVVSAIDPIVLMEVSGNPWYFDNLQVDLAAGSYEAHADVDSDGYGDAGNFTLLPVPFPPGMRFDGVDCNDSDPAVNPGSTEVLCNGKDDDCDGQIDNIVVYCTPKVNSVGCVPAIAASGYPNLSGPDNFYITASNVLNRKPGMMLWSLTSGSVPFLGGTLCLAAPITRTTGQNSLGSPSPTQDCTGAYSFHFSHAYMIAQFLPPNTQVYSQFWSRDPGFASPNNVGLTDALSFVICP